MRVIDLELDLDVFTGPFDLLLTLVLREEVDLLEVDHAEAVYEPRALSAALGRLLTPPPAVDVRHIPVPKVSVAERLAHLRTMLARGRFSFDEAVARADRVTVAVTLFALLELYKQGE